MSRKSIEFLGRSAPSGLAAVAFGLWHMTHSPTVFRFPPCSDRKAWHLLQRSVETVVRRAFTAEPSTEKANCVLRAKSRTTCCLSVAGLNGDVSISPQRRP